jgi:SNF2 family DNA or RNA helicase
VTYLPKTAPLSHQERIFPVLREHESYGLWWETGAMKSKPVVDLAGSCFEDGEIDGLLVVAPQNVHRKWIVKEIERHLPDRIGRSALYYQTSKATTKWHQRELAEFQAGPGLRVLAMTWSALVTRNGFALAEAFLKEHNSVVCLDESRRIKSFKAQRTKAAKKLGKLAVRRVALSGTAVANGPFDIFEQIRFLDPTFWERCGFGTKVSFENYFGVWRELVRGDGGWFRTCVRYQRLEELHEIITPISDHVRKVDVLDLPPKLYDRIEFEMTPKQREHYDDLERDFVTFLGDDMVTAQMALTRLLRLQQATCGYLPGEDGSLVRLDGKNPRLEALAELAEDVDVPGIVWARFTEDINQVCELLRRMKKRVVRYDGKVNAAEQARAVDEFQDGDADWFVGHPQACGEGHDLYRGKVVVYYSNTFDLDHRIQSEDRAHRYGMSPEPVTYYDLVAIDSVDDKITKALKDKVKVADVIMRGRTDG